jgi:2-methylfumaryl-CoA hydratase
MTSQGRGNYFEDFRAGQIIEHGPPRTISSGDVALYTALFGPRFAPQSAQTVAEHLGFKHSPIDDLLVFHIVFGKSVPDISLNAVANLGYAEGRFLHPVFPGDTLSARSETIGLKENSNRETGIVTVRTTGYNERDEAVLAYVRWVMVRKRDPDARCADHSVPTLKEFVAPDQLTVTAPRLTKLPAALAGSARIFADYRVGMKFDHGDGVTIEDAEHMMAARLFHNTARVHFNAQAEAQGRFGKRIVYGGHVISLARALSYNGLETAWFVAGINSGRHVAPCLGGDTVYAWSEVIDLQLAASRHDAGFIRLRTVAAKNQSCERFPYRNENGAYEPCVILDLDYWVVAPHG